MRLRLRQICLVARDLEPVVADLKRVFGLEVCYTNGGELEPICPFSGSDGRDTRWL